MAHRQRRRGQTWLFALGLFVLSIGTVAGFVFAREEAVRAVDRRTDQAALRASTALEHELEEIRIGLSGADALAATDGSWDLHLFGAYGEDITAEDVVSQLVLVGVAAGESTSYPVLSVAPGPAGGPAPGVDYGSEPERRLALRDATRSGAAVLSGPAAPSLVGDGGVVLIRPVVGDGPGAVGFVAAVVPLDRLAALVRGAMGTGMEAALLDGDDVLVGADFDRRDPTRNETVSVLGQTWTVLVSSDRAPDLTIAWLVLGAGGVGILTMAALVLVTSRHQRRLADTNHLLTRSEERTRAVQDLAGRLARALSGDDVVAALIEHLPRAVGARSAALALVGDGQRIELLGQETISDTTTGAPIRDDDASPIVGEVLSTGVPAWLSSPLAWRNDELTRGLADGGEAVALLPLVGDEVDGVLAVSHPRVHIFGDDERALLQTVSLLAATALARGRRYDAEHRAAVAFQRAALPDDLPAVSGLTVAARYRPATQQATVGGDWYDLLVLDEHRVVAVVGDVVGHGMEAAAAMGRLRTALQALVRFTDDPGVMLQALSRQVETIPNSFCTTVACTVVDLADGTITWCRAGHPPPLVLTSVGTSLLDDACLPPLGVAPEAIPPVHRRQLAVGDVVVLYTDGIVERRGESIDEGFGRLGIVAHALVDLDPDEFGDALVEAMVPLTEQADDLAVLVVRYDGRNAPSDIADMAEVDLTQPGIDLTQPGRASAAGSPA